MPPDFRPMRCGHAFPLPPHVACPAWRAHLGDRAHEEYALRPLRSLVSRRAKDVTPCAKSTGPCKITKVYPKLFPLIVLLLLASRLPRLLISDSVLIKKIVNICHRWIVFLVPLKRDERLDASCETSREPRVRIRTDHPIVRGGVGGIPCGRDRYLAAHIHSCIHILAASSVWDQWLRS